MTPSDPAGAWAWFLDARMNYVKVASDDGQSDREILHNVNFADLAHMRRVRGPRKRGTKGVI